MAGKATLDISKELNCILQDKDHFPSLEGK